MTIPQQDVPHPLFSEHLQHGFLILKTLPRAPINAEDISSIKTRFRKQIGRADLSRVLTALWNLGYTEKTDEGAFYRTSMGEKALHDYTHIKNPPQTEQPVSSSKDTPSLDDLTCEFHAAIAKNTKEGSATRTLGIGSAITAFDPATREVTLKPRNITYDTFISISISGANRSIKKIIQQIIPGAVVIFGEKASSRTKETPTPLIATQPAQEPLPEPLPSHWSKPWLRTPSSVKPVDEPASETTQEATEAEPVCTPAPDPAPDDEGIESLVFDRLSVNASNEVEIFVKGGGKTFRIDSVSRKKLLLTLISELLIDALID